MKPEKEIRRSSGCRIPSGSKGVFMTLKMSFIFMTDTGNDAIPNINIILKTGNRITGSSRRYGCVTNPHSDGIHSRKASNRQKVARHGNMV